MTDRTTAATVPLRAQHRIDEVPLLHRMQQNEDGFAGPMEINQFSGERVANARGALASLQNRKSQLSQAIARARLPLALDDVDLRSGRNPTINLISCCS